MYNEKEQIEDDSGYEAWYLRCVYDSGNVVDLDVVVAKSPEEAIENTFHSKDWEQVNTTYNDYQPCYHFRIKDAALTIYVWEDDDYCCPLCGSRDPFEPKIDGCKSCYDTASEVVQEMENSEIGLGR